MPSLIVSMAGEGSLMKRQKLFRFGLLCSKAKSLADWIGRGKMAESLGCAVFLMENHLDDRFAPIPALMAIAQATTNLHLGTSVLCNDYRHPAILAKLDFLSAGRFELGIGAGWERLEYDKADLTLVRWKWVITRMNTLNGA